MKNLIALSVAALFCAFPLHGIAQNEAVFNKVKQDYQDGDKNKDRDAALVFQADKILVKHRKANQVYAEIPNASITALTYEMSKHPRVKTAILLSPLALFSPGKKHWFTVQYKDGDKSTFVLLQLDKSEYQRVILEAETRTGMKVERVTEN